MGYYLIKVEGEILANSKMHYAQGWSCLGIGGFVDEEGDYNYDSRTRTVKGDLILDEYRRSVPYAVYCGEKGIRSTSGGAVCYCPGHSPAYWYYKENIDKILNQINVDVAEEIFQPLFRGLFTDVFSALELFLSDFMLCLIYTNEEIFEKAKVFFCTKKNESGQNVVRDIESKMHKFFFDEVVYHRFDEVEKMCKEILQVEMPDTKDLKRFLHKRNNIVHRYSFSNIDRMSVCVISKNDIQCLIETSNVFVNKLIENYNRKLI